MYDIYTLNTYIMLNMKRIIRKLISILLKPIYLIYSNKTNRMIKNYLDVIYSIWLSFGFKCIGCNVRFYKPISLIGEKYITIGNNTTFRKLCILTAHSCYQNEKFNPRIKIGNNCVFGQHNHITAINEIIIGNGVLTGSWVTITDNSHGKTDFNSLTELPINRKLFSKGKVIIGDNVWIGDKVTILPNVTIGKGVIIAANSVVTKDIPNYCVVGGIPAIIIKKINK